jgi:hypothetical protein
MNESDRLSLRIHGVAVITDVIENLRTCDSTRVTTTSWSEGDENIFVGNGFGRDGQRRYGCYEQGWQA